jgi:hypothetical protein
MTPASSVERRDRVRELVAAGLSYRQVSTLVGASHTQVAKDVRFTPRPPPNRSACGRCRGTGGGNARRPLPPEPTTARPGTPEKLAVLARRASDRQRVVAPARRCLNPNPDPSFPENVR